MRRVLLLLAILAVCALMSVSTVSASSEALQYRDCNSCVENGWGWSWSKNECGVYVNQNCDRAAAEAADEDDENDDEEEEEEEDDLEVSESAAAASEEPLRIPDPAPIPSEALPWANTEDTTRLWQLVNAGDLSTLRNWLFREPSAVHLRAEDGRGPLFWAYEYNKQHIIDFLLERGADPDALDVNNQRPEDLAQRKDEL